MSLGSKLRDYDDDHTRNVGGRKRKKRKEWLHRIDVDDFLEAMECLNVSRATADERLFSCPFPGHTHGDERPSAYMNDGSKDPSKATVWKCFAGDTRVITKHGTKSIAELAGGIHTILTAKFNAGEWKEAVFKQYGEQEIVNLIVTRNGIEKTIRTTAEHRWLIDRKAFRYEFETQLLRSGMTLAAVFPKMKPATSKLGLSPFGIARGITFGDGHMQGKGSVANLCGSKDAQLRQWFPLSKVWETQENVIRVTDLPRYFKTEYPDLDEMPSYLHGWLAGYFAADGDVAKDGCINLNSADIEHLEHVRNLCTVIGIGTSSISTYKRKIALPQGRIPSSQAREEMHRIRIYGNDLTPEFFLIKEHRRRFESVEKAYERRRWIVKEVRATGIVEPVYCCEVPVTHSFALEDNILTGNCHGCGRSGNAIAFYAEMENVSQQEAARALREQYAPDFRQPRGGAISTEFEMRLNEREQEAESKRGLDLPVISYARYNDLFSVDWVAGHEDWITTKDVRLGYLFQRGFKVETLEAWDIGYDDKTDRFTIPVRDVHGRIVGVKARTYKPKKQEKIKYLILGDKEGRRARYGWAHYEKSRVLFGIDKCLAAKTIVLVEGELDVIALWQIGIAAVATGGAALSHTQAVLLRDQADEVIVFYDSNTAGWEGAADVVADLQPFMRVRMVDDHEDDASKMVEDGRADELRQLLSGAVSSYRLWLD